MTHTVLQAMPATLPLDAEGHYLCAVRHIVPFVVGEEVALFRQLIRGKLERVLSYPNASVLATMEQAHLRLVEGYQPLILTIARRFARRARLLSLLDFVQQGNVGLLEALERVTNKSFHQEEAIKGSVILWVKGKMSEAVREQEYGMSRSGRLDQDLRELQACCDRLRFSLRRAPTTEEIASELHKPLAWATELLLLNEHRVLSLHQLLAENEESLETFLVDRAGAACTATYGEVLPFAVKKGFEQLTEREQGVLRLRYGLADDDGHCYSQREVAALLGWSDGNVSNTERRALRKLRDFCQHPHAHVEQSGRQLRGGQAI